MCKPGCENIFSFVLMAGLDEGFINMAYTRKSQ